MNTYVTGSTIKQLRESRNMTQAELAEKIGVISKTISKWETAKGLPDISLLQPLAQALGISVIELMNGEHIINKNVSANICAANSMSALSAVILSTHWEILWSAAAASHCLPWKRKKWTKIMPSPSKMWRMNISSPSITPWRKCITFPLWHS